MVCLALGNATLPAFQQLLHNTGKNTLFDSHDHLPKPFGWGPFRPSPGVSPSWCSRLVSHAATVPSADFFHAIRTAYPALSHFLPHAASRGKHTSFST